MNKTARIAHRQALDDAQLTRFHELGGSAWLRERIDAAADWSDVVVYVARTANPQRPVGVRLTVEQKAKYEALGGINFLRNEVNRVQS